MGGGGLRGKADGGKPGGRVKARLRDTVERRQKVAEDENPARKEVQGEIQTVARHLRGAENAGQGDGKGMVGLPVNQGGAKNFERDFAIPVQAAGGSWHVGHRSGRACAGKTRQAQEKETCGGAKGSLGAELQAPAKDGQGTGGADRRGLETPKEYVLSEDWD